MAESSMSEVSIVRCPKCQNLLPEPKDCSFFQCGGCGTILCAQNKNHEADSMVEDKAKDTKVNYSSRQEADTSLRHQQLVHNDTCPKPNVVDSGLDRYLKRTAKSDVAVGQDRGELVRKLDKLKEQLLQPKETQQIPSSSPQLEKAPIRRFPSSGKHVTCPSDYYPKNPKHEPPCPCNNNSDASLHGMIHSSAYGDPCRFHMHQPSHPQYSRRRDDDLFNTQQMLHRSTCSCYHCYDPYHRASGSVFPPSGLPDALHNVSFYPRDRSNGSQSSLYSPRAFIPSHPPGSRRRGHGCSRLVHPVGGGAPFINCRNCSKVLKLPDEIDSATRKQQRLRCGACSCLIDFSFADKKLLLSTDQASPRKAKTHGGVPWETTVTFSSDDYDNAAYEYKGTADVSTGQALIYDKAQEMQIVADSTSDSVSEDELSSDNTSSRKLVPDLPLREHLDHSLINARDRSEPRSQSSRSEQDRVTLSKTAMRQNSMDEASDATELDETDYSHNSEMSQDSANEYKENRGRTKKGGFGSIMKNSFKDLKKSIQNEGKSDVSVNGCPVAEHLVKMAEKQAGPIRPGNYWYDYRAGFWGVMGGQCLGILPPFIEELNYPMPENCAGGTTRVYVNGRELHQKDLRLLTARGLPRDKDQSYTIYISGRVINEDTGEELNSLGKLAPTVDKLKRGFGMRVPRRAT